MLGYEDFTQELIEKLEARMPEATILRNDVQKINGKKDGLTFRFEGSQVAPTLYVEDFYKQYVDGGDIDIIAKGITSHLYETKEVVPNVPKLDKAHAKKNLYAIVVNGEKNQDLLNNSPHRQIGDSDLYVIPRFKVSENHDGFASFQVTNDNCAYMGLLPNEAIDIAITNSAKEQYTCRGMSQVLGDMMRESGAPEEMIQSMFEDMGKEQMYVLTNARGMNGAIGIGYSSVMNDAARVMGEDSFYVLPSSIHETILIPKSFGDEVGVEHLASMVHEVNATQVALQEQLSDNCYLWNGKTLSIANGREQSYGLDRMKDGAKGQELPTQKPILHKR